MNLNNSFICINCDSIFKFKNDSSSDYDNFFDKYKYQCPACSSRVFMPLGNIIAPITDRNNQIRHIAK